MVSLWKAWLLFIFLSFWADLTPMCGCPCVAHGSMDCSHIKCDGSQHDISLHLVQSLTCWGLQIYPIGLKFGYVIIDTHWNNFYQGCLLIWPMEVTEMRPAKWPTKLDWQGVWLKLALSLSSYSSCATQPLTCMNCIKCHPLAVLTYKTHKHR